MIISHNYKYGILKNKQDFILYSKFLKRLKNVIISVVELAYIKLCAIGCMDNTINLWNI